MSSLGAESRGKHVTSDWGTGNMMLTEGFFSEPLGKERAWRPRIQCPHHPGMIDTFLRCCLHRHGIDFLYTQGGLGCIAR